MSDGILESIERQYGPFIHMAPLDKAIWARFLVGEGSRYAPFKYDVRVGDGLQLPAGASDLERRYAAALTTKRIDAVSTNGDVHRIFEVKPRAGLSAVGQCIGYRTLYASTFADVRAIECWLITDVLQPDMMPVLKEAAITVREIGR